MTPCHTPSPCPLLLGKSGKGGHKVLYGPDACWRRDGRPERKVGLQDSESPYSGKEEKSE